MPELHGPSPPGTLNKDDLSSVGPSSIDWTEAFSMLYTLNIIPTREKLFTLSSFCLGNNPSNSRTIFLVILVYWIGIQKNTRSSKCLLSNTSKKHCIASLKLASVSMSFTIISWRVLRNPSPMRHKCALALSHPLSSIPKGLSEDRGVMQI